MATKEYIIRYEVRLEARSEQEAARRFWDYSCSGRFWRPCGEDPYKYVKADWIKVTEIVNPEAFAYLKEVTTGWSGLTSTSP